MVDMLDERFPQATEPPTDAGADMLASTAFPITHWKQKPLRGSVDGQYVHARTGFRLTLPMML